MLITQPAQHATPPPNPQYAEWVPYTEEDSSLTFRFTIEAEELPAPAPSTPTAAATAPAAPLKPASSAAAATAATAAQAGAGAALEAAAAAAGPDAAGPVGAVAAFRVDLPLEEPAPQAWPTTSQ